MEAEAEYLRREIECNFWRWYFRTRRQRDEEDLGRERERCRRRWLALLEGWEVVCRGYFDPVRDPEEGNPWHDWLHLSSDSGRLIQGFVSR